MPPRKTDMTSLRKIALGFPDTEEGVACEGTPLERRTVKAGKKAFVFLGARDAMMKLRDSLPEATKLAREQPERFKVGANGWVKTSLAPGDSLPSGLLERWIEESYRLVTEASRTAKKKTKKK